MGKPSRRQVRERLERTQQGLDPYVPLSTGQYAGPGSRNKLFVERETDHLGSKKPRGFRLPAGARLIECPRCHVRRLSRKKAGFRWTCTNRYSVQGKRVTCGHTWTLL